MICQTEDCTREAAVRKHRLCSRCYDRARRAGTIPVAKAQPCKVEGCEEKRRSRGYCRTHYDRWRHGYPMDGRPEPIRTCQMGNCYRPHHTKGLCQTHYRRWKKYDDPFFDGHTYPECSVEGCYQMRHARDYCASHFNRARRHGNPLGGEPYRCGIELPVEPMMQMLRDRNCTLHDLMVDLRLSAVEIERLDRRWTRACKRGAIDLTYADDFACHLLRVHPALIWGEDYWTADDTETEEIEELIAA